MLFDKEWDKRKGRKLEKLICSVRFQYSNACVEYIEYLLCKQIIIECGIICVANRYYSLLFETYIYMTIDANIF